MTGGLPRRTLLLGGLAGWAAACGVPADPAPHPALRVPRPAGQFAFLTHTGDPAEAARALRALSGDDVMVGLGPPLSPGLPTMPAFPGDVLIPARSNPSAFVQLETDDADSGERLDALLAGLPFTTAWRTPVHRDVVAGSRPLQRNPFGHVEGQTNPVDPAAVLLPDGSSLAAVRVIRLAHPLWDADSPQLRDRIIGRRPDGTWLDGTPPTEAPRYPDDPDGVVIALDSHARAMNPRTADSPSPRMLRRSWTYPDDTADGVLFMAFQNDFAAGFAVAQSRLPKDALNPYLLAVGGGYFSVPGSGTG
ncbi:Dyp-type peroxidase [Actinokineospora guangxiensis]|uniref:Dyp-type peroxidase n=1 Tax=Actinokineospora guangxiensis TaxID=1490288 RepID=A0ABW0EI42_9PSEU